MKTDNELIAEFMGFQIMDYMPVSKTPIYKLLDLAGNPIHPYYGPVRPEQMSFNRDWEWIMPVVEKISDNYDFTIQFYAGDCNCYCMKQTADGSEIHGIGHGGFKPNIESVYKSVVAFVKWQKRSFVDIKK